MIEWFSARFGKLKGSIIPRKVPMHDIRPTPISRPRAEIMAHDYALYVDGRRVTADFDLNVGDDDITISVTFKTSKGALESADVDPSVEVAWGGWKAGDAVHLYQPTERAMPTNGYVIIESIEPPKRAGDPVFFVCSSLTAVHDWVAETQVCDASERVRIPATWFRK